MNRTTRIGLCALVVLAAVCTAPRAEVSFDVSVGLNLGDDARIFLNLTNEHYAPTEHVATAVVRRCAHPADCYPVVMFLAGSSGIPSATILDLRLTGLSWAEVMFRLQIGPRVLFAGLDRDPGPPYGNAWGHYKKHRKGRAIVLADRDIVDLAKLQITARHYGVSPYTIVIERNKGVSVEKFAADKHRRKHGGKPAHAASKGKSNQKGGKHK